MPNLVSLTQAQLEAVAEIDNSTPSYVAGVMDLVVNDDWEPGHDVDHDATVRHIAITLAMAPPSIIDETSGVRYDPHTDPGTQAVGFRATYPDREVEGEVIPGPVEFIMLNPSGGSDDGVPTVFLYQGPTGDPAIDGAAVHFVMFEEA